jgi:hypothetical protein
MDIYDATPDEKKRGLDMAFISGYNYSWIREKVIMNDLIINNLSDILRILYDKTPVRFLEE